MQIEQVVEAVEPHLPEIITGAANTFFTALIFGCAAFLWWLIKRRIEKSEAKEDERGPVLYKKAHDEFCGDVEVEHSTKIDEVLDAVRESSANQKDFRKEQQESFRIVHRRIDEGNKIMVKHLEGELSRKADA